MKQQLNKELKEFLRCFIVCATHYPSELSKDHYLVKEAEKLLKEGVEIETATA